jgi:hypothetical protein
VLNYGDYGREHQRSPLPTTVVRLKHLIWRVPGSVNSFIRVWQTADLSATTFSVVSEATRQALPSGCTDPSLPRHFRADYRGPATVRAARRSEPRPAIRLPEPCCWYLLLSETAGARCWPVRRVEEVASC